MYDAMVSLVMFLSGYRCVTSYYNYSEALSPPTRNVITPSNMPHHPLHPCLRFLRFLRFLRLRAPSPAVSLEEQGKKQQGFGFGRSPPPDLSPVGRGGRVAPTRPSGRPVALVRPPPPRHVAVLRRRLAAAAGFDCVFAFQRGAPPLARCACRPSVLQRYVGRDVRRPRELLQRGFAPGAGAGQQGRGCGGSAGGPEEEPGRGAAGTLERRRPDGLCREYA